MTRVSISLLAIVAAMAVASAQPPATPVGLAIAPQTLAAPVTAGSSAPRMTAAGGRVILSWLEVVETRTWLKFAERTASGWSEPRTVASGEDLVVNPADVPSVRRLDDGRLVAHWLQEDGPDPEAYKVRMSWSKDEGRTWSAPVNPHHDRVQAQHGFVTLFQVPGGDLGLVWLDGRAIKPDAPAGVGNMALRFTMFDAAGRQSKETIVDSRVCECCQTAAAATSEGVIVAYRNRSASEIRDIYVTRLVDGKWTPPAAVHHDGWKIKACPVNGPAVSARDRDVAVAWFTAKGEAGETFVAFSHDGGRTFGAPVRVDDGNSLGRASVELVSGGSAALVWVELVNGRASAMARRIDAGGGRGPAVRLGGSGGLRHPRIARAGDELLFAWDEGDGGDTLVHTARAPLR